VITGETIRHLWLVPQHLEVREIEAGADAARFQGVAAQRLCCLPLARMDYQRRFGRFGERPERSARELGEACVCGVEPLAIGSAVAMPRRFAKSRAAAYVSGPALLLSFPAIPFR
jgi:hypothetical protein